MSATQKFFRRLFGETGDRVAVPDLTAVDGTVSYETGYGFDYQRAAADPLVKNPERTKLNQVLYDVTLALRQYQTHGFPEFIQPADNGGVAYSYAKNAFVVWTDGQVYVSLVNANTSTPADTTKWQLGILGAGVGGIQFFPATTPPVGYLKANGGLLLRADYPALWAYALASGNLAVSEGAWMRGQFSPGDGALTFRIPDWRGQHPRAWDDGAGVDADRVLGSTQADGIASHTHIVTDPSHSHSVTDPTHFHGVPEGTVAPGGAGYTSGDDTTSTVNNYSQSQAAGTGISIQAATTGITLQATGIAENRVKNVAALACIKYL